MAPSAVDKIKSRTDAMRRWKSFVALLVGLFFGTTAALYAFVLLIDPYAVVPFSLPIDRRIVSINQRYMYPQIVRSRRFDSLLIGTSTARLVDPQILSGPFGARLANLAMDDMLAWEQLQVMELFWREVGPPKVLIVALDWVWCLENADSRRITFRGFPHWLYDDNGWNDYLYLLNVGTLEIAIRQLGYQLGLYHERVRFDGFEVFTPAEGSYDPVRAQQHIWQGRQPHQRPEGLPRPLTPAEQAALTFPALAWLDAILAKLPASSRSVLAFMPVHVAAQPWPSTANASIEVECKDRIDDIARRRRAIVVDWRIASPITREDRNYWDSLHYRLPIAQRLAGEIVDAAVHRRDLQDGSYIIRVDGSEETRR